MADELVEGVDYYVENGLWVFTAHYLLRRGYCCWSECRHCPYGYGGRPAPRGENEPGARNEVRPPGPGL